MLQSINILSSNFPVSLSPPPVNSSLSPSLSSSSLTFLSKPTPFYSVITPYPRTRPVQWLAQATEPTTKTITITTEPDDGPVELPPSPNTIFATTDEPTPLQVTTSVLLTGAITIFLFRSLRRRAKRAKELKFRSSGATKSLKEEALDSLKAMTPGSVEAKSPPSAIQALLGAISAGVIALILYKFTTTIEASLNRQTISDNLSVRQITITIRTIINGICYLATFVFGVNAVGLFLYSGQLAINSIIEEFTREENKSKGEEQLSSQESTAESPRDGASSDGDQTSDNSQ